MAFKPKKTAVKKESAELSIIPIPLHQAFRESENTELKRQVLELFKPGKDFDIQADNFMAAEEMHKYGKFAIPFLVHALESHPHKTVRDRAASSLAKIRDKINSVGRIYKPTDTHAYFHFNPILESAQFLEAYTMVTRGVPRTQDLHDEFLDQIAKRYAGKKKDRKV